MSARGDISILKTRYKQSAGLRSYQISGCQEALETCTSLVKTMFSWCISIYNGASAGVPPAARVPYLQIFDIPLDASGNLECQPFPGSRVTIFLVICRSDLLRDMSIYRTKANKRSFEPGTIEGCVPKTGESEGWVNNVKISHTNQHTLILHEIELPAPGYRSISSSLPSGPQKCGSRASVNLTPGCPLIRKSMGFWGIQSCWEFPHT